MLKLPDTHQSIVIRTDYSHQDIWEKIRKIILAPTPDFGFEADVDIVDDAAFQGVSVEALIKLAKDHPTLFIIDTHTLTHPEHPILCLEHDDHSVKYLRLIPSAFVAVENNLSIANMDIEDFIDAVDAQGIFRGFED